MLLIEVPGGEYYDEINETFIKIKPQTIRMEHSLISLSKWEAKWKKPFLTSKKTIEETVDYYRCMCVTPNVNPNIFYALPDSCYKKITDYIQEERTATTFSRNVKTTGRKEIFTSELIYYYMVANQIPTEYEKWHLSRLLTLLKICSIKNDPKPKKMSKAAISKQNKSINAARRAKMHSKG